MENDAWGVYYNFVKWDERLNYGSIECRWLDVVENYKIGN